MIERNKIDYKLVRHLFHYDKETGILYWKNPKGIVRKKGDLVGSVDNHGYLRTAFIINGKKKYVPVHRLIFLWVYRYLPENEIDHRDQNKLNNKYKNLREITHRCNIRNCGNFKHNTSGVKGIYWSKNAKKWISQISIKRNPHYLGLFDNFTEAVCHRLAAEQCLDWDGCDSSSPAYKYVRKYLRKEKRKDQFKERELK